MKSAGRFARLIIGEYLRKYLEAMICLEEGLEDSLQFYNLVDNRKISSGNVLEGVNM